MYDSTNLVPKPVVTGVSALGFDHVSVLGKTLGEIGWQKGGIYKVCSIPGRFFDLTESHRKGFQLSLWNNPEKD